jgi:hypothetical protein
LTVHLLSVGKTIIESLEQPDETLGRRAADLIAANDPLRFLSERGGAEKEALSRMLAAWFGPCPGNRDELAQLVVELKPHLWPDRGSAELETLTRAAETTSAGRPLPPDDIAVLISTDTMIGLTAALWNAVALTAGDGDTGLGRIRYLGQPGESLAGCRGAAVIVQVPGLDAGNETGFHTAMRGLGILGRDLFDETSVERDAFRFYLSGGFKAAIPYLIGLAEGLRSLSGCREVDAFVLHDTAPHDAAPIRLPLRRMMTGLVNRELTDFKDGHRRDLPHPACSRATRTRRPSPASG